MCNNQTLSQQSETSLGRCVCLPEGEAQSWHKCCYSPITCFGRHCHHYEFFSVEPAHGLRILLIQPSRCSLSLGVGMWMLVGGITLRSSRSLYRSASHFPSKQLRWLRSINMESSRWPEELAISDFCFKCSFVLQMTPQESLVKGATVRWFWVLIMYNPWVGRNTGTLHSLLPDFFFSFKVQLISLVDVICYLKKKSFIVFLRI